MAILKIGTQIYGVHKTYVESKKKSGSRILVGKVKSYQNINGKVYPIVKEVGSRVLIDVIMHYLYTDINKAVEAITTEEVSKN